MATLVALGPGDPDLVPLASWRAIEAAGPVAVPDDEPLAGWLGGHGIAIAADAPVAAASGERFRRLLAERDWDQVVPGGDALRDLLLADAMVGLQRLTERLRVDCPWDREQTAATIVPHTIEEAYEVAEAVGHADAAKLIDELGDLLFQAFFLALLCAEDGTGDLADVAAGITEKLVRRHPHVFGEREAETAGAVRRNWEQIKREDEGRAGVFHDVPGVLPALLHARKVQRRAAAVGYDWPDLTGPLAKVREELDELEEAAAQAGMPAPESEPDAAVAHEVGDLLFTVVNVARKLNVDPELALRATTRRFRSRVELAAELASSAGDDWRALDLDAQDAYYERAKESLA